MKKFEKQKAEGVVGGAFAVVVFSLKAQLTGSATSNKLQPSFLHFNVDGNVDSSQCTSVSWIPGSGATALVAGFASGNIFVYNKVQPFSGCFVTLKVAFCLSNVFCLQQGAGIFEGWH